MDTQVPRTIAIKMVTFKESNLQIQDFRSESDLFDFLKDEKPHVYWCHFASKPEPVILKKLSANIGISLPDSFHRSNHTRSSAYLFNSGYDLLLATVLHHTAKSSETVSKLSGSPIHMVLTQNVLLSFSQNPSIFEIVFSRLSQTYENREGFSPAVCTAIILDSCVQSYLDILLVMNDRIEKIESEVSDNSDEHLRHRIQHIRTSLVRLRKHIVAMQEMIWAAQNHDHNRFSHESLHALHEMHAHLTHLNNTLHDTRDITDMLYDTFISTLNLRMNETIRFLTVISTIFIPLSFITGVYGMNFSYEASPFNMPELYLKWGYPVVWLLMIAVAASMIRYFFRRKWL